MNKLIRERAATWARKLIASTHSVRNWTHEEAEGNLRLAWLAGARSLDAWHRQQTRRPVASSAFDSRFHVDVTPATEEQRRQRLSPMAVLTIPALGTRPVRPRPKIGQDVRLLVVRECFQVHLKVGDVGEVIQDHGGLLTVQWRTGHMWIDAGDVEVVES